MLQRYLLISALVSIVFSSACFAQQDSPVFYPVPSLEQDRRHLYPEALLWLILSKSDNPYIKAPVKISAQQLRMLKLVDQGKIDVFWGAVRPELLGKKVKILRIPIYRGLLGYRLVLINAKDKGLLQGVTSVNSLKPFSIGQGEDWPEVDMYRDLGLNVVTTTSYQALFKMLSGKRFDLFPRSLIEVWSELDQFKQLGIGVDEHVVLRYPHALFFHINADHKTLYQDIETGFKQILQNGEFEALFNEYLADDISRAGLDQRMIIDIPNPQFGEIPEHEAGFYYKL